MTVFATYSHNFGLVIPAKTGFFWEQQTNGVACNHVRIEGVYLPLAKPSLYDEKKKSRVDLLDELTSANYRYATEEVARIWRRIKKEMANEFEFDKVDSPPKVGDPPNQEGLQWIKITKVHSNWDWNELNALLGKTVALYYPNCD